jgi:5'-deoxynucleotidase YfbR-like HD superfamily hydrolase
MSEMENRTSELDQTNASAPFEETIAQLTLPYGLKETYRAASIGERKESVSEHIGSMLHLARWFIRTYDLPLDMARVVDLICDHDLPELDCGDTPIIPGVDNRSEKETKEAQAALSIAERLSPADGRYFIDTLSEYKAGQTPEAKFVRAIDKLDADLQFLNDKKAWESWSDEFYRLRREPYYLEVPVIYEFYNNLLTYLRSNGYLRPKVLH